MSSEAAAQSHLALISERLDAVLAPLGFAGAQIGVHGSRAQAIFCRSETDADDDGCVDLVVDVEASPSWRVTDVRYWGFPADRWHLDFDRTATFSEQLADLASRLPEQLA
jgi:hypothetical protein